MTRTDRRLVLARVFSLGASRAKCRLTDGSVFGQWKHKGRLKWFYLGQADDILDFMKGQKETAR